MTTSIQALKNGLQSNLMKYQSIGALFALGRPKIKQRTPGLSDLLMLCWACQECWKHKITTNFWRLDVKAKEVQKSCMRFKRQSCVSQIHVVRALWITRDFSWITEVCLLPLLFFSFPLATLLWRSSKQTLMWLWGQAVVQSKALSNSIYWLDTIILYFFCTSILKVK